MVSEIPNSTIGGYFSFQDSRFSVTKSKKNTGRVYMYSNLVPLSMTIEASFCGTMGQTT